MARKFTSKVINFDMDGTIANLYGVEGWLEDLRAENIRPYELAKPLYDMDTLNEILDILRGMGWKVVVTTWLAKESTKAYSIIYILSLRKMKR